MLTAGVPLPHLIEQVAREAGDGQKQQALASEPTGQPASHGEDDCVRYKIGGERPRRFIRGRRETAGNVWQRYVDHRRIEDLHEGTRHDRNGDQPGIDVRTRLRDGAHSLLEFLKSVTSKAQPQRALNYTEVQHRVET